MKELITLKVCLILVIIFMTSCQQKSDFVSEPTKDEANKVAEIGSKISKQLLDTLKTKLITTLKEKGAVEAIKVCQVEALPMTIAISKSAGKDIEVKRISTRIRNPGNLPVKAETMALEKYEKLIEQNQNLPEFIIQKVNEEEQEYFLYYKPLKIAKPCLTCHGNPEKMNPEVIKILKESYPHDKAIGYNEGDFRGLVRVKVKL